MTQFFDLDRANALVPELAGICGRLKDQRGQLVVLRDELVERQAMVEADRGEGRSQTGTGAPRTADPELRTVELRIRALVDQMQAAVAWLDERGIVLRDIPTGLVDFPALVNGRQVWLCWRLGEDRIEYWHELSAGFPGRQPLIELV